MFICATTSFIRGRGLKLGTASRDKSSIRRAYSFDMRSVGGHKASCKVRASVEEYPSDLSSSLRASEVAGQYAEGHVSRYGGDPYMV